MRLDGSWYVDGGFHGHLGHAVFEDAEFQGDLAGHFNRATEGYLTVALGEV